MICEWCSQVFTLQESTKVIKGQDGKWYHPDCLKEKNDKEEKDGAKHGKH